MSAADGTYSLSTIAATAVNFTAPGFEDTRLALAAPGDAVVNASMRRKPGAIGTNSTMTLTLSPSDMGRDFGFGSTWCEHCQVITVVATTAGEIDVSVRWSSAVFVALWQPALRRYTTASRGESAFTARVPVMVGETILYVGDEAYMGSPLVAPMQIEIVTRQQAP